jgi:hypothetical protein
METDAASHAVTPIAPGEVLLHVGVHKTGTTALQAALADARPVLAEHGVRYPGDARDQHAAVLAGAGKAYGWRDDSAGAPPRRWWKQLVSEARFDGRSIISSEFLDDIAVDVARRIVDDLGGPKRVHVAVTLRAVGHILPSAWQQQVKKGTSLSYRRWLRMILADEPGKRAQKFWYRHDQVAQVARWADIVGPDRTHVVIIAAGDHGAIFRGFEALLALPNGVLSERGGLLNNRSMTRAEAEFVRRLNKEVTDELKWDQFNSLIRRGLVLSMVEQRDPDPGEPKLETPGWAARRAAELGRDFATGIAGLGVDVIGDPEALAVAPRAGHADRPQELEVAAAVAAVEGLVNAALAQRRELTDQIETVRAERTKDAKAH